MVKERGFIQLPVMAWAGIAVGIVILGLSIALRVQSSRLDSTKKELDLTKREYASFVGETKRLGNEATKEAARQAKEAKDAKEKTDAKLTTTLADLDTARRKLRDARKDPGGSVVPAPSPGSPDPTRICFDRAEFARAIDDSEGAAEEIAGEGAAAVIKLNGAREWAQKRRTP